MTTGTFIWPEPNMARAMKGSFTPTSIAALELQLHRLFPSGHPVLVSSGRAALSLCLAHASVGRADQVEVFAFASHCVVDAVGRHATVVQPGARSTLRVVHHQWGYIQDRQLAVGDVEDAVDTMCAPGTEICPGGDTAEIWSFPKILGTLGGGVIWRRDPRDAEELRKLRNNAGASLSQWLLRIAGRRNKMAHLWWQGAEASLGQPHSWQLGELAIAIANWDEILEARRQRYEAAASLLPGWLRPTEGRHPSAVPVVVDPLKGDAVARKFGLISGMRHFQSMDTSDSGRMIKVLPVPVHHGMPLDQLLALIENLEPMVTEK